MSNKNTQVFGHRGACGYIPENTIESFILAFEQKSDAIEFDLVPTLDNHLVIRHEPELSTTTNVAAKYKFQARQTAEVIAGEKLYGWFSHRFTLAEIKELKAVERYTTRKESASHNGLLSIPTLSELLSHSAFYGKTLIIELKHPDYFLSEGFDLPQLLKEELDKSQRNPEARHEIIIESFDFDGLVRAKELIGDKATYVMLAEPKTTPPDLEAFIDRVKDNFAGLSLALPQFIAKFDEDSIELNNLLERIKARGLLAYTYTARVEDTINLKRDFAALANAGFDGVFADQPDTFRNFLKP